VIVLRLFRCFCVEVSISLLFCCCFRNRSVTQFRLGLPPSVSWAHTCAQVCYCPAGAFLFFHMSQTWRISQDANKSNGVCAVCLATRQLHHRDGNVHRHGPRDNPCPGSNKRRSVLVNRNQLIRAKPCQLMPPVQGLPLGLSSLVTGPRVILKLSNTSPSLHERHVLLTCPLFSDQWCPTRLQLIIGWVCLTGQVPFYNPQNAEENVTTCQQR